MLKIAYILVAINSAVLPVLLEQRDKASTVILAHTEISEG